MAIAVDTLSRQFLARIIELPTIECALGRRRLEGKGVKFINPSQLASPRLYTLINVSSLVLVCKVETNKVEISTSQANGRRLTGYGRSWAIRAERYDGICYPNFLRFNWRTLRLHIVWRLWRDGREDNMVRGEMKGADSLVSTAC